MRHVQTVQVPYYSRGLKKWWKLGNATAGSSLRVWRDGHHYVTETAKTAWSSGVTSTHHDTGTQCPSHGSRDRQSNYGIHGSVYGALIPGSRIGRGSCTYV